MGEGLTAAVDQYCERTDAGLWSEPLNAVSNLAFLLAAIGLCLRRKRLLAACDRDVAVLIGLVALVAAGSALFHTVATVWARLGDVIPIGLTLVWYLMVFLRRIMGQRPKGVALGIAAFLAVTGVLAVLVPGPLVNGSNNYFGTLVALVAIGVAAGRRGDERWPYFGAAVAFALALVCRSIDEAVCATWPWGTHFLWHTLNGVALLLAGEGLIRGLARRR